MYVPLWRRLESGKASWQTLTASEKKKMAEVVAMWTTAANQGHVGAQFNLGAMYLDGQGVAQDPEEATRWFRKAADHGHANAHFNLGVMYWKGRGVSQDIEEAARWFRKAANQGHALAQKWLEEEYRPGVKGAN
jgi:TPR repeat protein